MKGTVIYGPRDIRFEDRPEPRIVEPTDADHPHRGNMRVRVGPLALSRAPARVATHADGARVLRHRRGGRQRGEVSQAGPVRRRLVRHVRQHVPVICRHGYQSSCVQREFMSGPRPPFCACRWPTGHWCRHADVPPDDLVPSLLATSDVLGTGWFAADAANVKPGSHRRGRRRRRGRPARCALGQADGG